MTRRAVTAATLSAALALGGIATAAAAQDDPAVTPADESTATTTGIIVEVDGIYYLQVGETLIKLEFGPSWFDDLAAVFGDLFDAEGNLIGDQVDIAGNVRSGPNEHASDVAKAKVVPKLRIKSVNGQKRTKGKPAWAGGPKAHVDAHPGSAGYSKGQAKKAAKGSGSHSD